MKKGLKIAIVLALTLVLCISIVACKGETTLESLKNEYGILVEGGGFKEGAKLVSTIIELTSDEGKNALEAIKDLEYNKDGEMHIFDISVLMDGVEVQPDGKVKVTLPAPSEDVSDYDVFHIKDNNTAEKLIATYLDGKVSFETDSFSMFVVVEGIKHSFYAYCEQPDGGYLTENGEMVEFDGGRLVAYGTQITLTAVANADYTFKGWYYYDKSQVETLISTDATHTFTVTESLGTYAKFEEKEKHSFYAYCEQPDGGYLTENGEMVEFDGGRMVADGTQITLTAVANTGYTFKGWYYYDKNQVETLISADATHTFTVTESLGTYAKFEEKTMYTFLAQCYPTDGGYIIENNNKVDFGNGRMVDPGTQITLTAVANKGFVFVGWGTRDDDWNLTIISADATHTFVVTDSTYVQAVFEEEPNGLKLDAHNAGFTYDEKDEPTTTIYKIGSEFQPDAQKVLVYATYPTQEDKYLTINTDYTIDLGGLDFAKEGTYTITYTYKADTSLKATLTVQVVGKDYHEHTFSKEWSQSETHHWHDCTAEDCKATSEYAEHSYEDSSWEIIKPATETEEGKKRRVCK